MCYKLVQSFRVHCLFISQFNTQDYGTFTDVLYSRLWYIYKCYIVNWRINKLLLPHIPAPNMLLCSIVLIGTVFRSTCFNICHSYTMKSFAKVVTDPKQWNKSILYLPCTLLVTLSRLTLCYYHTWLFGYTKSIFGIRR